MRLSFIHILFVFSNILSGQDRVHRSTPDGIPADLPLPTITTLKSTAEGYIFAAVPYWGTGNSYLVIYDNHGKPVYFKKTPSTCTDFKVHENGLLTYYDYASRKFFAMDSTFTVVDSFWVQNGFITDEHDIKILRNENVLLIGHDVRLYDMSRLVEGGDRNASVVVNVIQELDKERNVVFEWKAYEHYRLTDVGPAVNLRDPAFVHTQINSVDVDHDNNLIISSRNLDEITKVDRRNGTIMWRFGGKNNQFAFLNDSVRFSAQHSARILPNGNILIYDNGLFRTPHFSRAVEYRLDTTNRTSALVWSFRNSPDVSSIFWGSAQRLPNGNTFISWGLSDRAATEVDPNGEKVFEMLFPKDVFSYRIFRFPFPTNEIISHVQETRSVCDVRLDQNFPNPFNPSTTISYGLSVNAHVALKVFDVLGREVMTLVDETQQPGTFAVQVNPINLPSGMYLYRMQADGVTMTKRMFYLK